MLLTVDRGNIPQVASDKRHWPRHRGILQDTAACSAPVVATRVCVCVRAHWGFASRKRSGPWCVCLHSSLRPVLHGCMLSRAPLVLPFGKCDRVGEALQPGPRRAKGVCGRRGGLAYVRVVET